MDYRPTPIEWSTTPESLYYPEQSMCTSDLPEHNKTAGLASRAFKIGMSEPAMISLGAYGRTRDKMNNINNNTMNYSLGKTF